MILEFVVCAATVALCLYFWQRHALTYWQRNNVKFLKPKAFVGNMGDVFLLRKSLPGKLWEFYTDVSLKPGDPLVGVYNCTRPVLVIRDLELIKRIMIKDFNDFPNHVVQADPHHDALGNNNLFFAKSAQWRMLRPKLSPIFTSLKIKQMYPLITEIGRSLETLLATYGQDAVIDVKNICNRYTNEVIGTIAFGIRANSLSDPNNDFFRHSLAIFELTAKRAIDFLCVLLMPKLGSLLRVKFFSEKTSKFLRESVLQIINEREGTGTKRSDLIDTLVAMKQEAKADPTQTNPALETDFLVAQVAIFQSAGFETSASTMTFALYELAKHPDMQDRLRAEIRNAFESSKGKLSEISLEKLQLLSYLGQVLDETLRLYPVGAFLEREYAPSDGKKGYSLAPYSDFVLPPGMALYVSMLGVHRNKEYWPEPEKFNPERFAPENRHKLNMNAYMPFGIGPRNCIGLRFGLLQTKLGLAHLLKDYRVVACEGTPKVIEFDPHSVVLTNTSPILLKLDRVVS